MNMPGSWNGMEFNPRLGKWTKTLGRARLPEGCGRKRRNVDLVLSHMSWGSAELLTALGMKLNSSLFSSTSTSMSFGWHDSYSCVSADSFSTTAFLFFCETPLLTDLPFRSSPVHTDPELPGVSPSCCSVRCSYTFCEGCLVVGCDHGPQAEVAQGWTWTSR